MNPTSTDLADLREEALRRCASEPIQIPGSIQPHGVLLGIDPVEFQVVTASDNTSGSLGRPASELIGLGLAEAVGDAVEGHVRRWASAPLAGPGPSFLAPIRQGMTAWNAQARVHRQGATILLELEQADQPDHGSIASFSSGIDDLVSSVNRAGSLVDFCQLTAEAVRTITGYDRTMVYRFHADDHGEVIAESARADLKPYLGLHYPASDIPRQARDLFLINRVRILADRRAKPVPMISSPGATDDGPLDMTHCSLRSFSPIHLEYLENMGVGATLAISISKGGRLWGLLVCHHQTPRAPSHSLRATCNFLSEMISAHVAAYENLEHVRAQRASADLQKRLLSTLADDSDWVDTLLADLGSRDPAIDSSGIAVVEGAEVRFAGVVPPTSTILRLVSWIAGSNPVPLFSTEALGESDPEFAGIEQACGALAIEIGRASLAYVVWFRPEFRHEVSWGGDPRKGLVVDENGVRLSPRKSFQAWTVEVQGRSAPWGARDLAAAAEIRATIVEIVLHASLLKKATAETNLVRILKAVEAAGEPILITDQRGWPILVNDAYRLLFGVDPADIPGPTTFARIADSRLAHEILAATLGEGGSWRGDVEVEHPGGSTIPVSLRVDPVGNEAGQIVGFIAIHTDLTERRRAERELIEHAGRLERAHAALEAQAALLEEARTHANLANQTKSNFLANMSHEIRTPMNGVLGMTELLLGTDLDDVQRQYATTILSSGDALLVVINDILDLSKIEAGKMTLNPTDFDLREILKEVTNLLAPLAGKKGLRITAHLSIDLPERLRGDSARIRQILINLAGNAVKFTDRGEVTLTADLIERVGAEATLRLIVRDTGIGIPPSQHDSIFQSFSQAEGGLDRRFGGTGLGLTISRKLAELMDGRLDFTSEVGRGSSFWLDLTLPVPHGPSPAVGRPAPEVVPNRPVDAAPLRILVAEDNPINQAVALGLLGRWHHRIEVVANGREAVEAVSLRTFDLIFMDVQMPVLDGMSASARIRDLEGATGRHTPIIAMTAHAMEGDRARCLQAGMDDYISKPIDAAQLAGVIERWRGPASMPADPPEPVAFRPIDFLDQLNGSVELARLVLDSARATIPETLGEITARLEASDLETLAKLCHRLKGGTMTITADTLTTACIDLEVLAKAGDLRQARLRLPGLLESWDRLKDALRRFEERTAL